MDKLIKEQAELTHEESVKNLSQEDLENKNLKTSKRRIDYIEHLKNNGVKNAYNQYEYGIRKIEENFNIDIDDEYTKDKCTQLISIMENNEDIIKSKKYKSGNKRNWISYLKKYIEYKDSLLITYEEYDTDIQISNNDIVNKEKIEDNNYQYEIVSEDKVKKHYYSYNQANGDGENKIFYGTPGCGKSYYVDNMLSDSDKKVDYIFRTTFFQDYTNTDFVGQILPTIDADKVSYSFNPAPFTLALKCAIEHPNEKVALVIEELNRGNAPSVFGDLFQLLDRKDGTSQYAIVNVNIQKYLQKEIENYKLDYIKIPANMYIYATMNTSDQNVFTLDTAFKRRWKFEKISNIFNKDDGIGNCIVPKLGVKWKYFVETINEYIVLHSVSLSSEDKQLGKYFVDEKTFENEKEFGYKIFEYLWNDVAKFNRKDWFGEIKTLDELLDKFYTGKDFFVEDLKLKIVTKEPNNEEKIDDSNEDA